MGGLLLSCLSEHLGERGKVVYVALYALDDLTLEDILISSVRAGRLAYAHLE